MNSPVEIGAIIAGKYRVERVLGQGGMGVVVVAMHDELDQRVAIKFLLHHALTDVEWVARFAREARAAARIKSEHAVKVYDVGKLDTGAPYMVMEFLDGRDLQTILNDRQKLPVSEAVEYVLQACEAIAEAHGVGIVHRDLKPANLFVTHRADGSSCVKILDFGISKMSALTGSRDEQTVTNTSAIVGSPLYMSPEQMRASKNVDRRTDIWSLGVILQELVSGMPSFVAETTAELCALVLTAPPTALRDTLPDLPRGLDAVIEKCLKKNSAERYANIAELASALEPFGPPSVKMSVERIVRLSGPKKDSSAALSAPEPTPAPQPAPVSIAFGQTELSDSGASKTMQSAVAGTAAAWGASQAIPKRSRLPFVVGGSALAAFVVLIVLFVVLKKDAPTPTTNASATATANTNVTANANANANATVNANATGAAATATTTETAPAGSTAMALTHTPTPTAHPTGTTRPSTSASHKPNVAPVDTTGFGGRN